jgi:hypothetical protein
MGFQSFCMLKNFNMHSVYVERDIAEVFRSFDSCIFMRDVFVVSLDHVTERALAFAMTDTSFLIWSALSSSFPNQESMNE